MKRIPLEDIFPIKSNLTYDEIYRSVLSLIEQGRIRPLLASGTNGKKPALYR